ncbi:MULTISPECIES: Wzz/FepE/Etk N-terminal domain-containing protein [Pasteurellaceae]|uniref:Wzz/FepE/Etk N-terminal domain-containing protein n=1 Tax=Pasteurella atlantica TaxID=2827233 RepID=A0AAW8CQE3_9PAST|nr:Wzz/FepE/Etk N-terminal domain-containing protein [Pasteurella atlantica]MBR0572989.1 hypothetical protein [Pasteurella atlantica]MDP8038884.1 Wzz/FepE/Etk N-terminal domain-containing protein [Pasteurella atlantica]MDP8041007.1 Wzz/FepE/Etk N-terminal domain-containing protein [Pasteurella atlantica]MDP8043143.1 Wzz/FepE/Etk N-terminal domain-containing protein [Pasteurella atlantica]MDP8045229.1 Wzz/FepE/Etk N-terminal domain-containing protein [Pasteurella atlantica]
MNSENTNVIANDEIDLLAMFKNLFRQRGLIIAFTLAFFLFALAFQFSKLAFYTPKTVNYPIAIEFISSSDSRYPNGVKFSPEDIIVPENIKLALEDTNIDADIRGVSKAISIEATNSLIKIAENTLLNNLSNKKITKDQVEETKASLDLLKNNAKTYVTLSLDLSQIKLSENDAKKLLKAVATEWSKNAVTKGLVSPNISYPQEAFVYDKNAVIIDNYDKLLNYSKGVEVALEKLSMLDGSNSISVNNYNLNDLTRTIKDVIDNDINVMRSYTYSISPELVKYNKLLEMQIFSQLRVKELDRAEINKKIATYDFILSKLSTNIESSNTVQQPLKNPSIEANMDKSMLNDLLHLGSQLSSSELKKEIINKRIAASEKLFSLEKEIDMIAGSISSISDTENQQKTIAMIPTIFENTVKKVNESQKIFMILLNEYKKLSMNKNSSLYSTVAEPYIANSFGFNLKKSLIILFASTFMGLFIGMGIALLRSAFLSNKK